MNRSPGLHCVRALSLLSYLVACVSVSAAPVFDITFANGANVARLNGANGASLNPIQVSVGRDNRITIVATSAMAADGSSRLHVARLTSNGVVDAAFGNNGSVELPGPLRCVERPGIDSLDTSRVVVLVSASDSADCSSATVRGWIILNDGRVEALAVALPASTAPHPLALAADGTGKMMVVATSDNATSAETILARLGSSGARDGTFGVDGRVPLDAGAPIANRDGRLMLLADGTWLSASMAGPVARLARWTQSGALIAYPNGGAAAVADFSFGNPRPRDTFKLVTALRLADGANLVIAGRRSASGSNAFIIARGATTSTEFAGSVLFDSGLPYEWPGAVGMDDATTIIAENVVNAGTRRAQLRRLFTNASFDLSWGPDSAFPLGTEQSIASIARDFSGRLVVVGSDASGGIVQRLVLNLQPNASANFATEFRNDLLDHYFITTSVYEASAIERGEAGVGWRRTAYGFRAFAIPGTVPPGTVPVCRFYGNRAIDLQTGKPYGPNSHVYVPNGLECDAVKRDKGWIYEGIAFYIHLPVAGECGFGKNPIRRFYNGRYAENDSNHRYTTSPDAAAAMVAAGWRDEGVVMCEQFTTSVVPGT